jgi:hypothetical protein
VREHQSVDPTTNLAPGTPNLVVASKIEDKAFMTRIAAFVMKDGRL